MPPQTFLFKECPVLLVSFALDYSVHLLQGQRNKKGNTKQLLQIISAHPPLSPKKAEFFQIKIESWWILRKIASHDYLSTTKNESQQEDTEQSSTLVLWRHPLARSPHSK